MPDLWTLTWSVSALTRSCKERLERKARNNIIWLLLMLVKNLEWTVIIWLLHRGVISYDNLWVRMTFKHQRNLKHIIVHYINDLLTVFKVKTCSRFYIYWAGNESLSSSCISYHPSHIYPAYYKHFSGKYHICPWHILLISMYRF